MNRSLLHEWKCGIEICCRENLPCKMTKIAEDIYNTAYERGKNSQEPILDKIREEIKEFADETIESSSDYDDYASIRYCLAIVDKYIGIKREPQESEDKEYEKELNKLKAQILEEGDTLVSKQDLLDRFVEVDREYKNSPWNLLQILTNIDLLIGEEPCDDCISRQAVLSKIKEVCFSKEWVQFRVDKGSNGQRDFLINYIEQLSPVTPQQESCEDCISRQAVIDVIERWLECSGYNEAERHIMRAVQSVLYDSPSVNPQQAEELKSYREDLENDEELKEIFRLIEDILDTLIEVGNGVTDEDLHESADKLFKVRDILNTTVNKQEQIKGRCRDCRYFEYDHWENVSGIPLIVAHEMCMKWSDGCKTSKDGYCFLFEEGGKQ